MEEGERGLAETIVYVIPQKDHGRIIGKGGATIKELEASYRVRINIDKGSDNVSLSGGRKGIEACATRISQIVGYIPALHGGATSLPPAKPKKDLRAPKIQEALFFPDATGHSFETFLAYLQSASKTLDVAVYTISAKQISDVLLNAHRAGVKVRVITDNETVSNKGSDIGQLAAAGIEVRLDGRPGNPLASSTADAARASSLFHHKFAVLDGLVLINGSFNWTSTAASLNSENLTITNDPFFVQSFAQHFNQTWAYFEQYRFSP